MSDSTATAVHVVRPLADDTEAAECARIMANSEPWLTLGRTYEASLAAVRDPAKEVHVLVQGAKILGFVILDMRGAFRGFLQTICVHADHRGAGLGTHLLEWAEERVFRESPNFFLCVSSFNTGARRLYERRGYSVVGELEEFLVPGHAEILMRKSHGPWAVFSKR